jgi:O-antigen ligase
MTRSAIYRKSWEIIREHPILGVGFGTITQSLGTDERGAGLNESNIFLQIWAGCGILGLMAFTAVIGYLFIYAFRRVSPICLLNKIIGYPIAKDDFKKSLNFFAVLGILSLIIPNLFNAGLLMGLFWLGLAIFISCIKFNNNLSSRT